MKKLLAAFSAVAALGLTAAQAAESSPSRPPRCRTRRSSTWSKPLLAKEGVDLKIKEFTDYVQPNVQVSEKRLDANFFQHQPYLDEFNKAKGTDLVAVTGVTHRAAGRLLEQVQEARRTAFRRYRGDPQRRHQRRPRPAPAGQGRGDQAQDNKSITATPKDIVDNPKNIKIRELEAATLPRVLTQVDMALINTNYALEAKLNPTKDALAIEGSDSPYVNILVARPDNKDSDAMQKLAKALHSAEVKQFIQEKYKGAVVPAF